MMMVPDWSTARGNAGVMACSPELWQGDLVAVSIAMEEPGSPAYITRGSLISPGRQTAATPYIGVCLYPVCLLPALQRVQASGQLQGERVQDIELLLSIKVWLRQARPHWRDLFRLV